MRRLAVLLAATLFLSALSAGTALADDALEQLMEDAGVADFAGRGIVLCTWGADSAAATYSVTRTRGMSVVSGAGADLMTTGGIAAFRSGAGWSTVEVGEWSPWALDDRYTLAAPEPAERFGRSAEQVTVLEDGRPRATVVFDGATGVPLLTEILDGDGKQFRVAAMIEFGVDAAGRSGGEMPQTERRRSVWASSVAGDLPERAAWYRRVDLYAGPEGVVHAYYTDGLFSFSVFESDRGPTPEPFKSASEFEAAGHRYLGITEPLSLWVQWHAPDRSYVLVGDLPPDHLDAVLADLPAPGERSPLVRLWRWLFG
jgi:hypothetical protein